MEASMAKKLVVTVKVVDEGNQIISSQEVSSKEITPPTDISNFGYNKVEQLEIIKDIQQAMLDGQVDFLKSKT